MKKLILICGLLASSFSFGAKAKVDAWNEKRELCESFTEVVEGIMKARQRGVSLKDMYAALSVFDGPSRDAYEKIVKSAYSIDIANTNYESEVIVLEYSNGFFESCMNTND